VNLEYFEHEQTIQLLTVRLDTLTERKEKIETAIADTQAEIHRHRRSMTALAAPKYAIGEVVQYRVGRHRDDPEWDVWEFGLVVCKDGYDKHSVVPCRLIEAYQHWKKVDNAERNRLPIGSVSTPQMYTNPYSRLMFSPSLRKAYL
jgi:hypothetical protein